MPEYLRYTGYFVYALYVATGLWMLLCAGVQLHLLWHYRRRKAQPLRPLLPVPRALPFVTIQVPVYNERAVIGRLLQSLAHLDYPRDRFEVQVLDDSTDATSALIDEAAAALRRQGLHVQVRRRSVRTHFKAGALQEGLGEARGTLIALFDADFLPPADFLRRLVPQFADPAVGLVQARWGHLNRDENYLTRIQTFLLDTHFSVEQAGRSEAGYFINFCGTAGIWRRRCIEEAGGWDGGVLSEDLDLSYRAQLKGWRLVYAPEVEVPAELPAELDAFRVQQFRWTKGMAQAFRKLIGPLWRAALPRAQKWHGALHLLGSFLFVCVLLNAVLTVPLLLLRNWFPEFVSLTEYSLFTGLNLVALTIVYHAGLHSRVTTEKPRFWRDYPLFLVVYMALSVQNAIAVLQGLSGHRSAFVRTPKKGSGLVRVAAARWTWINSVEAVLFAYFLCGIGLSVWLGDYFLLLFFVMIASGLGYLLYHTVKGCVPAKEVSLLPARKAA
ncbi:glycosyltransferase [Flaviaesturariibacter amylovorans]|uniref:Glycosyltransferase n=1 Tax=Flaviaesturariibacter amylovorans TaxID=1084520 RepID=A0ABP8HMI5_9BACT